jgi:hypothetical protein
LNRWFGIPVPAAEPDDRRPEEELAALTPAIASRLHMRPLHELAREVATAKLETARARRQGLDKEGRRKSLRADLAARLGDIEPNSAAPATVVGGRRTAARRSKALRSSLTRHARVRAPRRSVVERG